MGGGLPLPAMTPQAGYRLLVVGGCGGMGRQLVRAGVGLGLDICVLDLEASCSQTEKIAGVEYIPCNVSSEADVTAAFARIGEKWDALDGLVNLVGYTGERVALEDMETDGWHGIIDASLHGMFYVARAAAPLLRRAQEQGRQPAAVLVSSTFGVRVAHTGYAAYAVAKAGVMNLVRALASEWSPAIRVNGIAPGVIETAFLKGGTGRPEKKTHLDIDRFMHTVPMERLGQPEEIVWPTLFLLGAGAGYITGQTLHVNGGTWMAA
ncbi:SDR family oxidoreductase [Pusillimonas sp. TS35]|nr:SDR family oxidoreductase [Pusillimonas sp. TS35]